MDAPSTPASASYCPQCQAVVDDEANKCPYCGALFPNLRQRQGDPWGGLLCGLVRGVAVLAFVAAGVAVWQLLVPPFDFREVVVAVIGAIVFGLAVLIAGRLDAATYRIDE